MKKKTKISILVSTVGLIILGILIFLYANTVESVVERNGKYFDESGKQLGTCKIENKTRRLADISEETTYYYSGGRDMGQCKGSSIGCAVNLQKEPQICSPIDLQTECDKSNHPTGFAVKAKHTCVIENSL